MKNFEDLVVFQRATDLAVSVYRLTESFPPSELYGMTSQKRRASLSVMRHLAEGQGRLSLGEWRQFLSQARGSLYEVQSDSIAAVRLGFLSESDCQLVRTKVKDVGRPLAGLIRYVLRREREALARRKRARGTPQ